MDEVTGTLAGFPVGKLRHHSYSKLGDNDNLDNTYQDYPEQVDERWEFSHTDSEGVKHRRPFIKGDPEVDEESEKMRIPQCVRTHLQVKLEDLPHDKVQLIADTAESREDFNNYNHIHNGTKWPRCLCAVRVITGEKCIKHFMKGPDGKTVATGRDHWVWQIDIAPQRCVCPLAYTRIYSNAPPEEQACREVLIKAPTSKWVLEQDKNDPEGTLAGRAVTDIVQMGKFCPICEAKMGPKNTKIITEDNELIENQAAKTICVVENQWPCILRDNQDLDTLELPLPFDFIEQPVQYLPGATSKKPWMCDLVKGGYYIVSHLPPWVPPEHLFIPQLGITLQMYFQRRFLDTEKKREEDERQGREAAERMGEFWAKKQREEEERKAAEEYEAKKRPFHRQQWHFLYRHNQMPSGGRDAFPGLPDPPLPPHLRPSNPYD